MTDDGPEIEQQVPETREPLPEPRPDERKPCILNITNHAERQEMKAFLDFRPIRLRQGHGT